MESQTSVYIEKLSHDGRGIARINGKTTFISGALPQETVTFSYTRRKKDFDEATVCDVVEPSPSRVTPRCDHYGVCGGCSLQHLHESAQIHEKQTLLLDMLARTGHVQPETVLPPLAHDAWHYRHKARLSVRYVEKKQTTLVGFREKNNPRYLAMISSCSVLHTRIAAEIKPLQDLINGMDSPRSIAQIEVAAGDDEIAFIVRHLEPLSEHDAQKWKMYAEKTAIRLFLQPAGPSSVHLFYPEQASEWLHYSLPAHNICFEFHPTDFTQVHTKLNALMVDQALALLELKPDDRVLDLFCGLGNFSLPMARQCAHVTGIEGSDAMVLRATHNAQRNGLQNKTSFFCADLNEEVASLQKGAFNKVLLDPPRAGALTMVKQMAQLCPERIVYVSCHPMTLARDAQILVHEQGYRLLTAGVMDMFPHTAHVESIALFSKE